MNRAGPTTVFLVRDDGWVFANGQLIPKCVFDALADDPASPPIVEGILQGFAVPGAKA